MRNFGRIFNLFLDLDPNLDLNLDPNLLPRKETISGGHICARFAAEDCLWVRVVGDKVAAD